MANMQGRSGAPGMKGMMSDEAILAIKERMTAKKKGAGWRPLPRRGNVKKQIVKDVIDVVKGRLRTSKNSRIAPEKVGSVSFEENGQAC